MVKRGTDVKKFDVRYYLERRLEELKNKNKPELPEMAILRQKMEDPKFHSPILERTRGSLFLIDAILHSVNGLGPDEFVERNLIEKDESYGIHLLLMQINAK